jgi:hypothetical protein
LRQWFGIKVTKTRQTFHKSTKRVGSPSQNLKQKQGELDC